MTGAPLEAMQTKTQELEGE